MTPIVRIAVLLGALTACARPPEPQPQLSPLPPLTGASATPVNRVSGRVGSTDSFPLPVVGQGAQTGFGGASSGGARGDITLEDECADVTAVLDAAGSERAVLFGYTWGGPVCIRYARVYPERVRAMVLYASVATANALPG